MSKRYSCAEHPYDHDSSCCPDKTIHSSKDQTWAFTHRFYGGDTVHITSKGQFDRECKKRGLVRLVRDDLVKNGVPYKPEPPAIPKQKVTEIVRDVIPQARQKFRHAV